MMLNMIVLPSPRLPFESEGPMTGLKRIANFHLQSTKGRVNNKLLFPVGGIFWLFLVVLDVVVASGWIRHHIRHTCSVS
jgi:hypothetical protein